MSLLIHKMKMAQVKKEAVSECLADDAWLSEWANPVDVKDEEKPILATIKTENITKGNQELIEQMPQAEKSNRKNCRSKKKGDKCSTVPVCEEETREFFKQNMEALKVADVSDMVTNLCEFRCPKCHNIFLSKKQFTEHLKKTKHAAMSRGLFNKYLVKIVAYKCCLCSQKIICDRVPISCHVKYYHKISMEEYYLKTGAGCSRKKKDNTFRETLDNALVSKNVANLCEYQCPKCETMFQSQKQFGDHISKTKHASIPLGSFKKHLLKIVTYKCEICSLKMICDRITISSHVNKRHKISMLEYYSQTGAKSEKMKQKNVKIFNWTLDNATVSRNVADLCEYQCPKCSKIFSARDLLIRHFKKTKHVEFFQGSVNKYLVKVVAHKCYICSNIFLSDKKVILSHISQSHKIDNLKKYCDMTEATNEFKIVSTKCSSLPEYHFDTTGMIANLCKFSCQKCKYSSWSWGLMARHLRSSTHTTFLSADQYATRKKFHKCFVCKEVLLCDSRIICSHAVAHQMKLADYRKLNKKPVKNELYAMYCKELKDVISKIPVVEAKPHYVLSPNSLPNHQVTRDVGNCSFFKCPRCNESDLSYKLLLAHCKKEHQMKHVPFNSQNVAEARYHKCHVCDKIVLCDEHLIARHIRDIHKSSLTKYVKEFVLKSGGRAFPVFADYRKDIQIFESFKNFTNEQLSNDISENGLVMPSDLSSESEESD